MVKVKERFETFSKEMRTVYCEALIDAAKENDAVFVLDCDLASSMGTKDFIKAFPNKHLNCGIQESNACGLAAGMSVRGFIPFLNSFGVFTSRRIMDQVYISCAYAGLNVKIVGADPGVTAAVNGGTHMALEDVGTLRVIPDITILDPCDPVELKSLVRQMAGRYGVDYLRLPRKKTVQIYDESSEFEIGKAALVQEGTDVTIIACGIMVFQAIEAARALAKDGISARVLDMFTIKPIDAEAICESARKTGAIVTAENHNVIGALRSAVAEVLAEHIPTPMESVGVMDRFGEVGSQDYLMKRFDLTAEEIVRKAKIAISRKI